MCQVEEILVLSLWEPWEPSASNLDAHLWGGGVFQGDPRQGEKRKLTGRGASGHGQCQGGPCSGHES